MGGQRPGMGGLADLGDLDFSFPLRSPLELGSLLK